MSRIDIVGQNGNDGDHYNAMLEHNEQLLRAAGITYRPGAYNGSSLVFYIREAGMPAIDFFPHTGRWRLLKGRKSVMFEGGANKFINWYSKINKED